MSTVGTASATESHVGEGEGSRTTAGERDEDMFSTGTNYRGGGSVASGGPDPDAMDEDMERYRHNHEDDRMSDDGSASLVGFGEGAGSTVSGPIYHRRPAPGASAVQQQAWGLDRTNSGLSEGRRDRDTPMAGTDTPMTPAAIQECRDARMMDGIAADQTHQFGERNDNFVDTTFRGGIPVVSGQGREAAENIVQRLDHGEANAGPQALGNSGRDGPPLGQFYFEGEKK